ncbi:MAG: type I restriction endonuclease subunit M [Verrucomicrobiota bacterium]
MLKALARHERGDWGEVCTEDRAENEEALRRGGRLLSVYRTEEGTRFYIITEADRSSTTVLLPDEY